MLSAFLFAVTIVISIVIHVMLRGKNLVNITAEGAGRITSEQNSDEEQKTRKEINATINYAYPLSNIAGYTSF